MIPANVQNYWEAQWWEFLHIGLPLILIVGAIGLWVALKAHREDMHVNDEPDTNEPRAGKTLGL